MPPIQPLPVQLPKTPHQTLSLKTPAAEERKRKADTPVSRAIKMMKWSEPKPVKKEEACANCAENLNQVAVLQKRLDFAEGKVVALSTLAEQLDATSFTLMEQHQRATQLITTGSSDEYNRFYACCLCRFVATGCPGIFSLAFFSSFSVSPSKAFA